MIEVIKHHFFGGIYAKEMKIPDHYTVVSHEHTYDHLSILSQGSVVVEVDGEVKIYHAPAVIEVKAGLSHAVTPLYGDAYWFCIHATDCTDESKIDDVLIKPVFEAA